VISVPDLAAPYIQRGVVEILLLAVIAGVLGTWVVLRRLPFYTHAIGTATFPGLVVAGPWGVPAQLTALACAVGFGGVLERIQRSRRIDTDAAIGLLLVAALAIGVVLASDVYEAGAGVDRLLFGSLIALTPLDLWLTAAAAIAALAADGAMRRSWLATGFDPDGARSVGVRTARADRVLLIAVAIAVVVALDAVGALLVTVVLTVPAATVRLFEPTLRAQQLATAGLAAVEGLLAIVLADAFNVGPGPTMAVIGALVYAAAALAARGAVRPRFAAAARRRAAA
jgi:manganese/iron transport system permease protein